MKMFCVSCEKFLKWSFRAHVAIGTLIRLLFILYGEYHDRYIKVPFTDIDYHVFTDAARYVWAGNSPYKRYTFRYSPIFAILLTPNIFMHRNMGKIFFCIFDALIAIAIRRFVRRNAYDIAHGKLRTPEEYKFNKSVLDDIAKYSAMFWLYNPFAMIISARGNADSFSCLIVIYALVFCQTKVFKYTLMKYCISGFLLGLAIHLRIYPIIFSFPMYLSLRQQRINRHTRIVDDILSFIPNRKQWCLISGCIGTIVFLTWIFYKLYDYEFLFETYFYHAIRKDFKHNFSLLFYHTYLFSSYNTIDVVKTIAQACQFFILLGLSLVYGSNLKTLSFCVFTQSVTMVIYNSVLTSQYFIWFLSILPLCVQDLNMTCSKNIFLFFFWLLSQGGWLYYAYVLEFMGGAVFVPIWLLGMVFFLTNIYILTVLIKSYTPGHGFGLSKNMFSKKIK